MNNNSAKVLVVDDDKNLILLIKQVLEIYNINCDTAENGEEAFKMIKLNFYHLIISDIKMPHMTGTELLREVKKLQVNDNNKSKFILMTAYSTNDIITEADKMGVDNFITKPFDINQFISTVQSILNINEI